MTFHNKTELSGYTRDGVRWTVHDPGGDPRWSVEACTTLQQMQANLAARVALINWRAAKGDE